LKLSKKPRKSVVSEGVNRSAEEGKGGGGGNMFESAGSNVNWKSERGTGGCISGGVGVESGELAIFQ
jgi:hypothetical protein